MAPIVITMQDVLRAGGVPEAIEADCPADVGLATAAAMGGQAFATSGPGPGWSRDLTASDYARAAIERDAAEADCDPADCSALDPADGRWATARTDEDGEVVAIEWSAESVVRVVCPDDEDLGAALADPELLAEAARAALDEHAALSDRDAWAALVRRIRAAAEALDDVDLDAAE